MKKQPFLIISLFLLFLAIGLLLFQFSKVPKEVEAVVGTLNLNAQTTSTLNIPGGIWNSSGNVGIGTTGPTAKLDIIDTSNTAASFSLTNNTATTIGVGIDTLGVLDLQSTSLTTGNFLNIEANALTSGKGINLTSTSTGLTGDLANFTASGSDAAVTGNVLKVGLTGALATGTALNVTTAGASGYALRVNDDGTYTDSTPFVVDAHGNVGIGTTAPGYKLDVAGTGNFTGTVTVPALTVSGSTNICTLVAYTGGVPSSCTAGYSTSSTLAGPASGHVLCCR